MNSMYELDSARRAFFEENGYVVITDIISDDDLVRYSNIYDGFLNGRIDSGSNRSDLGVGLGKNEGVENITQIMWPSDFVPEVLNMTYHRRALEIARGLEGADMEMDFDMLINKAPNTGTVTPWHQDAAYWINMPDKRAVSCWLALDEATLDSGCMWYIPGSHLLPLRSHRHAGGSGSALICDASESEGVGIPLKPGSCVLHHGATLHYSRGNTTPNQRRAFIINFRPAKMIAMERASGFDHGRTGNASDRKPRSNDQNN
jgi:ectoine hydroxylase-related dioxygenase (phytanoyl-CoA dioxygenase family)